MMTGNSPLTSVRVLDENDIAACVGIAEDREWAGGALPWRFLFRVGQGLGIDDPDGGLAAVVVLSRYAPDLAVLGNLLVKHRYGRRGLGRTLVQHALDNSPGQIMFLYATAMGRPLYERLHFEVADAVTRHVGVYAPDAPGDFFAGRVPPLVRPPRPADRAAVLDLDRAVFGADRSAALAALAATADQIVVAEDDRGLVGHAAAVRHGSLLTIGPLIARDDDTARALIAALASGETGQIRVDLASRRDGVARWAQQHGLAPGVTTPLMAHAGRAMPGAREQLYAPMTLGLG
jgi:predicted N-acetyltransferase YhbS